MKTMLISAAFALAMSASPLHADELFEQNPYECVFATKVSRADNAARRTDLANCMMKASDVTQALRALDSANYQMDYILQREVERKAASGQQWYARALLGDLIMQREQTPARIEQLKNEAALEHQKEHISLCLSHPERVSPARDRACRKIPGFRNSNGRINPSDAVMHSTPLPGAK